MPLVETARPDILISDIGMPDVDGYEFLRRIRALDPARGGNVPAIALTAFARPEDRARSLKAGFSVHVSKPIQPETLTATVASLAGRTARIRRRLGDRARMMLRNSRSVAVLLALSFSPVRCRPGPRRVRGVLVDESEHLLVSL